LASMGEFESQTDPVPDGGPAAEERWRDRIGAHAIPLTPGTRLDQCEIESLIGSGRSRRVTSMRRSTNAS
jgi:hypothetical protein